MSIRTVSRLSPKPTPPHAPRRKHWTVAEFHRLWEGGWFEGVKTFLIDGEIIEMPVPNEPHCVAIGLTEEELRRVFAAGFWVRIQFPLVLGHWTDPVPDLCVVPGPARDYLTSHPVSGLLVVEVSDSSLAFDLGEKACLYAAGGILDYWVIDLNNRVLIVHRDPVADSAQPHGFRYATVTTHDAAAAVSPLAAAHAVVRVADLLP